jgi:hypothetical protein
LRGKISEVDFSSGACFIMPKIAIIMRMPALPAVHSAENTHPYFCRMLSFNLQKYIPIFFILFYPIILHLQNVIRENIETGIQYSLSGRKFSLTIAVDANRYTRTDKFVEVRLNFTSFLEQAVVKSTLLKGSLQLFEVDTPGDLAISHVLFQFNKVPDFDGDIVGANFAENILKMWVNEKK